jgi:hypothetical protein
VTAAIRLCRLLPVDGEHLDGLMHAPPKHCTLQCSRRSMRTSALVGWCMSQAHRPAPIATCTRSNMAITMSAVVQPAASLGARRVHSVRRVGLSHQVHSFAFAVDRLNPKPNS